MENNTKQKRFYKVDERVRLVEKETFGYVKEIDKENKEMTVEYRNTVTGDWEKFTGKFWEFDKDRSENKRPQFHKNISIPTVSSRGISPLNNTLKMNVALSSEVIGDGLLPEYGTTGSAGLDIFCNNEIPIIIKAGEMGKVPTGIKVAIPTGFFGAIYPRSSAGTKLRIKLANTVGIIDSDYRGEIILFIVNDGDEDLIVNRGDRLVQMIIQPYAKVDVHKVYSLDDTQRGEGGFGSTGK